MSSKPHRMLTAALAGCASSAKTDDKTIVVGARSTPHAEILAQVKDALAKDGWTLEVKVFDDYVLPNKALNDGELDANYFQHTPYLESFNAANGTELVSAAKIHYEPFGIYANGLSSLSELADGATIIIPADDSNETRALLLLQDQGYIKLKDGAGITATVLDIVENPKNIEFSEVEAAQLPNLLPDVDYAVINSNYAISAGLNPTKDALALELSLIHI